MFSYVILNDGNQSYPINWSDMPDGESFVVGKIMRLEFPELGEIEFVVHKIKGDSIYVYSTSPIPSRPISKSLYALYEGTVDGYVTGQILFELVNYTLTIERSLKTRDESLFHETVSRLHELKRSHHFRTFAKVYPELVSALY